MRSYLDQIYFGKTKDVVGEVRSVGSIRDEKDRAAIQRDLILNLKKKQGKA
jgi:F-actin-capping protein subunit beta